MTNNRFLFRAWHNPTKRMFDVYCFTDKHVFENTLDGVGTSPTNPANIEDCVLEQCTGLKDENGKLIYEGDIVRIFYDHFNGTFTEKEVVGPVKWECGTWIVNNSLLNHSPEYDETHLKSAAVEVIGNIHENPELLEVHNGN